jgi:DNA repair exonuclease SbcCD ATPase subunit
MSPTVRLSNFVEFIQENIKRIEQVYQEIEEVQQRFNGLYSDLLADWQRRVETTAEALANAEALPPEIAEPLAQKNKEERAKLRDRIEGLEAEIEAKRKAETEALEAARAETARLRELNPVLDQREEALKARSLEETERITKLEGQLKEQGLMNRLLGAGEIKADLREARETHQETLQALKAVRQEWVQKKKEVEERQGELQAQWKEASIATAQGKAELDYLTQNLDALVARRGAQAYLTSLQEAPEIEGDLGATLQLIAQQNTQLAHYRSGLASVAESLGLLDGIRSGMIRFNESTSKVYEEQRRYNLRALRLDLPRHVVEFHNAWGEFRKRVRDEKRLGQHPLEFIQVVEDYKSRLDNQSIQRMFESMGAALNQATKAWD